MIPKMNLKGRELHLLNLKMPNKGMKIMIKYAVEFNYKNDRGIAITNI
jgi:hypothetical protein